MKKVAPKKPAQTELVEKQTYLEIKDLSTVELQFRQSCIKDQVADSTSAIAGMSAELRDERNTLSVLLARERIIDTLIASRR